MTIETSPAQSAPRPAATEPKNAKPKAGEAASPSPGGFMAILASLDASEPAVLAEQDTLQPGADAGAIALAALQRAAAQDDSAGDVDLAAPEADLQKLLQGGVDAGSAALPALLDESLSQVLPVDTSALLAQAAHWVAKPVGEVEQSVTDMAKSVPTSFAGALNKSFGLDKGEGVALVTAGLHEAASDLAGKAGRAQKDAFARLVSAQAAMAEPTLANNPVAETRQAQILQRAIEAPLSPIASALAATTLVVSARSEDMGRERSIFRSSTPDVATPVQTYMPSAASTSFSNVAAPMASLDAYVAEKVAYWVSNDVQNAEMTLDGIGEMPVEVSIRMQGNEAHVAFRSDELQARAALENASEHLKDLLKREGLVLSGVSVGTAGTGDGGAQERNPRQGAPRQVGVVSVQPSRTDSLAGHQRGTGGALDLFV